MSAWFILAFFSFIPDGRPALWVGPFKSEQECRSTLASQDTAKPTNWTEAWGLCVEARPT